MKISTTALYAAAIVGGLLLLDHTAWNGRPHITGTRRKRIFANKQAAEYLHGMESEIIPEASLERFGNPTNIKQTIAIVKENLTSRYVDKTPVFKIKNLETGFDIEFNRTSVKKMFSSKIGILKLTAFTSIEEIISIGKLNKIEADSKNRNEIIENLFFDSKVSICGKTYYFGFNVRRTPENRYIYNTILTQ